MVLADTKKPFVVVILVNYAGASETLQCLKALQQLNYPNFKTVVVDNQSPDDSVEQLNDAKNEYDFYLIESTENGGFSAGNNQGIMWALEQYGDDVSGIWLLNNDTEPKPDALTHLVNKQAISGSLLKYPNGTFQQGGIRINRWTGQLRGYSESKITKPRSVDAISGASLFIPRHVLDTVGLLDESHFLYVEDVDYCLAAKAQGFETWLCPKSVVIHAEGASTGKEGNRASLMTQYYYQRNRMVVLSRYVNPLQWLTLQAYTMFRWLRMGVKALFSPSRRDEWRVLSRSLWDYACGISGNTFASRQLKG